MSEVQKRSFSQINSSNSNRTGGSFFIKPPTSPIGENLIKERIYSPPMQHRRTVQPQSTSGISSSSFTSLSSINGQESIHHLLPKPPLSVTNRQSTMLQQTSIPLTSADFSKGNIVQQIHQKLIQQRSLPTQQRGANFNGNGFTKIETGGLSLVNNVRSPSPIIARRVQNLSNSVNHNNSGNNLNNSASHNNSIDVIVNNPQENMQQDIVLSNEKEYLKNQLRQINEKQIFLSSSPSPAQNNFVSSPPQTIRFTARSDLQPISSPIQQFHSIQQTNLMSPPTHALISPTQHSQQINSPKPLSSAIPPAALFIKSTQLTGGLIETQQTSTAQGIKKTVTHLSESAKKLLDTYKRQKEILFDQVPPQIPQLNNYQQNDIINANLLQQFKGAQQSSYVSGTSTPNLPTSTPQQPLVQYNVASQQFTQNPLTAPTTLKEVTPYIQTPETIQSPLEKQRSSSQKGGINISSNTQQNNLNYSSLPQQMMPLPGSCALTKITTRPVTSAEEKNLIEEYKQKNNQRRNSFSQSNKSTGRQLPTVVEAPLEQSMRLSSLLVNTSVFNQARNSASQSRDNSLEVIPSKKTENNIIPQSQLQEVEQVKKSQKSPRSNKNIQSQQQAYIVHDNIFKDFSSQNQIVIVEDFDGDKNHLPSTEDQGIQADFQEQYCQVNKEIMKNNQIEEEREVIRSAQTHYIDEGSERQITSKDESQERNELIPTKDTTKQESSPKNKKVNHAFSQQLQKEKKYQDAQTSPIRTINAKYSNDELNSLITDTNLFESKTLVESQFVITESSTVPGTQQALFDVQKKSGRLNTRHSDKINNRSKDTQQELIDDDYMKNRKKEIYEQIKEKKVNKKNGVASKTPRGDSSLRLKPSTPNNKQSQNQQFLDKIIGQHASPTTKRDSRISLDSANMNNNNQMKQSKNSFEGSVTDSQTQSVPSVQQLALQKRDEILDKIKHIDEQIILHQKIQNLTKEEDIQILKSQNKMIIANSNDIMNNIPLNSAHNRSSHMSQKSNQGIEDTPIKKIQQSQQQQIQSSSATNIQLPVTQQQINAKGERNSIKRSESNSSLRRQGSNRKIEGFVIQSHETSSQQVNQSNGSASITATTCVTTKNSQSSNYISSGSNKFLNNFKDSFVNKSSKVADFSSDMTQAQKHLMSKGKSYKQYPNPVSQPSSSRSTNNIKKKDLKISNILDKSQESRGTCLSSTTTNKSKNHIYDLQQSKKTENEIILNLTKTRHTNNFNTKENLVSEPLGVINLFEITKNKKRDNSTLLNRNQSREDLMPTSPSANHYFRVSDKLKEFEKKEAATMDSRKLTSQSRNREFYNSRAIDHSTENLESKSSAKFNSVLQDMSNYHADSKNLGFTIIPPTQELDLEAEHNKRIMKQNKQHLQQQQQQYQQQVNANPYLLKKDDELSFQGGKQNVQIKGNKYQFSFDKNLEQEDRIPSCSFSTKYNDAAGFIYDCSPIPQRNKVDEDLSEISNNYLQEQQEQLSQIQIKQLNRLDRLEEKLFAKQYK